VTTVQVESAQDMLEAVIQHYQNVDVVIKTAAVADYRPKYVHDNKMKKKNGDAVIELERTEDILKTLGEMKDKQLLIGFAAERTNVEEYATKKLREKKVNMIVANDVKAQGGGFGTDTYIVTMSRKDGEVIELRRFTKHEVGREILK
uniref:phosphopantothenoylcysteine decarboxylase domain-containing protein n=1 Tax=Bacillus sp. JEM-1 TaxID=1977090 RepID=UPI0011228E2E